MNLSGREPQGIVSPGDLETTIDALRDALEKLPGPEGQPQRHLVYRPEELFTNGVCGSPPDLFVYLGELSWRAIGDITPDVLHTAGNSTGPDSANHDWDGMIIAEGTGVQTRGHVDGQRLEDVAGMILSLLAPNAVRP